MTVCCSSRNPTKKDCCLEHVGCTIETDDFNRPDSSNPGDKWCVISGDWEVKDGKLNCVTEGIIVVRARQPNPTRLNAGYNSRVEVQLVIPETGDATYKVITAFRNENDYQWVKLEYNGSTGELIPTFYGSKGETNVVMDTTLYPGGEIWTPNPGSKFPMQFCNANVEWAVSESEIRWQTCFPGGVMSLPELNVGAVGFINGEYDDFVYEIHWESDLDCDECFCFCVEEDIDVYRCLPEAMTLTITQDAPADFTCPCVDGLQLGLHQCYDPDTTGPTPTFPLWPRKDLWYSDPFFCEGEWIWFILQCPGHSKRAALSVVSYPDKSVTGDSVHLGFPQIPQLNDLTESTCTPLSLVFKDLSPMITTCDLPGGGTGTKAAVCSVCQDTTPTPVPTWTVHVTE